jgi:hypothetical protein
MTRVSLDAAAFPCLIEARDFEVSDEMRLLALQGDWDLVERTGPTGGRYVIANHDSAHRACLTFLHRVSTSDVQLAMIPELAIPVDTVVHIISAVQALPKSLVFLGGVEGMTREEYESLLKGVEGGETQALIENAPGNYVNSFLLIVKTPSLSVVHLRAKRVPSRPERLEGPPMARGAGPFTTIRLGKAPITIVPLLCSEFVWPELWTRLDSEVHGNIDLIPVLQHNDDVDARHTGAQLHHGYTRGGSTADTRFVFVNQAISKSCDGACYVVAPPTTPPAPKFDHSCLELWTLPGIATYKGFRIPDLTGCIWFARIVTADAPTSALATPVCEGGVTEVLNPPAAKLRGLVLGLMRTAEVVIGGRIHVSHAQSDVRDVVLGALNRQHPTCVLHFLTTDSANAVFYEMQGAGSIGWPSVEAIIRELVEAAALLASAGDDAYLMPCEGGNYRLAGRPVLILHAPEVDEGLTQRFLLAGRFEGTPIPVAVLLLGVVTGATTVDAKRIGDVLRADRVTSASDDLADFPKKAEESSVTIRVDEVEFRSLHDLRGNMQSRSLAAAQARLRDLFPKVYA